jgi:ubiquitin C-terminal hydrolase
MGCGASKPANVEPDVMPTPALSSDVGETKRAVPANSTTARSTPAPPSQPERQPSYQQEHRQQHQNHGGGSIAVMPPAGSGGKHHHHQKQNGTFDSGSSHRSHQETTAPPTSPPVEAGVNDPQWKQLWAANKGMMLDPMDVHAQLQDLMGEFSNKLSPTEILFLQRKVRSVVRQSQLTAETTKGRKMRKHSSSATSTSSSGLFQDCHDTKAVVKNYHLLTPYVLRRVLPQPPVAAGLRGSLIQSPSHDSNKSLGSLASVDQKHNDENGTNSGPPIQVIETMYLLALYCHDSLWDRVAEIAKQSAEANGLEMDVNKQIEQKQQSQNGKQSIPEPCKPTLERVADTPNGVGLHTLTFLLGLALSKYGDRYDVSTRMCETATSKIVFLLPRRLEGGTRQQQLNLLFYLLLAPEKLREFLERHPAGGVPTWLLEVGQQSVISLASLSHYYWYGGGSADAPFTPLSKSAGDDISGFPAALNKRQQDLALTIPGRDVVQFFMMILLPEASVSSNMTDPSSPDNAAGNSANISLDHSNNGHTNPPSSPVTKKATRPFKRRASQNSNVTEAANADEPSSPQTELTKRLQQEFTAATNHTWTNDTLAALGDFCTESSRAKFAEKAWDWLKHHPVTVADMTILDFDVFCKDALDDGCVSAIMHRLFAQGWIPTPSMELDIVKSLWREWQESSGGLVEWSNAAGQTTEGTLEIVSQNVRKILGNGGGSRDNSGEKAKKIRRPFGGLGGFDGRGGTGFGVLYCIDKKWWDDWEAYVGWSWAGDSAVASHLHGAYVQAPKSIGDRIKTRKRPGELSTNKLVNREDDYVVAGSYGSYEFMKSDLKKERDFVLVPPAVWDVLFELYSGGPPLPRMVKPPDQSGRKIDPVAASEDSIEVSSSSGTRDPQTIPTELDLDTMASADNADRVLRIPRRMEVETHPWILNVQLCDPQQPYRKQEHNDAGPITIRIMATPDQPLWRLYAEIVVRFPFHLYKAYAPDGRGKARLWKRIESSSQKGTYPPWPCNLVCKNRAAILPGPDTDKEFQEGYDVLRADWEAYGDHATVESSGIVDGHQLIVEFAEFNRSGEMTWPREAAAKAGLVRRLAEKDKAFRCMLMGLDGYGKSLAQAPELVGISVDAMDQSGRWYPVTITHVRNIDADTDEEDDDESFGDTRRVYKQVCVDFSRHGGHPEWIDVESDHLASSGRYTTGDRNDKMESLPKTQPVSSIADKNKAQVQARKTPQDNSESNAKLCTLPGYGACGLTNMGNTCYINSALQCISYFPMLRAYLLSGEYRSTGDLNKDNPLGTEGRLIEEFVELLRIMWSGKYGEKTPVRMRHLIAKLRPDIFAGADQQDAQELLSYVLDALMEDSNRVKVKPYGGGLDDDWVKSVSLRTVGEEAWRRDRRRSRSIMTDVVTGQFLSTTTCPACKYASQKFDIFNLLSLPLPTVADVYFKCFVIRRANALNTPWILNKPRGKKSIPRFNASTVSNPKPPSDQIIVEQYIIGVSRLADSNDLRQKIMSVSGIPFQNLIVCSAEEKVTMNGKDDGSVVRRRTDMNVLNNKKGPCGQLAPRQRTTSEDLGATRTAPTTLIVFESTIRNRRSAKNNNLDDTDASDNGEDNQDQGETNDPLVLNEKEAKHLESLLVRYGNHEECRLFDTDMLPIAKAVSRSIWPTCESDLTVGLRVDALDQKNNWCPGSVIEVLGRPKMAGDGNGEENGHKARVRIHFDHFSYKWDELFTIDDFKTKVQPLYSHAPPRTKRIDFIVHHRFTDRQSRVSNLFGQSFYVQCHSEWSTARAGAQILAQASRFLQQRQTTSGPVDIDAADDRESKVEKLYERTQQFMSDTIDLLIDYDRQSVMDALGCHSDPKHSNVDKQFQNPGFDYTNLSAALLKRMNERLHRLPFEVRIGNVDAPLATSSNEDASYPFALTRTIGNFMGARNCIILQWKEPPSDKKGSPGKSYPKGENYLGAPVMYNPPKVVVDEESAALLSTSNQKAKKFASGGRGSAGLPLGNCLSEFCKAQKLGEDDNESTSWRCPRCKVDRPGASQKMVLWRLPDILSIHLKRFRSSHKFREKISTKVNFPLTGLDMKEWCHPESQAVVDENGERCVYDLIGVLNHSGILGGGHYIATCKATPCNKDGREEVAYAFNGVGTTMPTPIEEENDAPSGWKTFGRPKAEVNPSKAIAAGISKATEDSVEPLWLQFDDEFVEPIPPRDVVTEMAYVLFYRRRRLTSANVARYSTLE